MDNKEARSILGVARDASKNDIEKRYSILLKKYRMELNRLKAAEYETQQREDVIDATENSAEKTSADLGPGTEVNTTEACDELETVDDSQTDMSGADNSDNIMADDYVNRPDTAQMTLEAGFKRITEAYNVLMGYEVKEKDEVPGKAAPVFKMVGINEKKAKNFFYYYKYHILGSIILIAAVIYFVQGCVNRVTPDFNAAFVGRIGYFDATKALADSVKAAGIPIIEEPGFDGAYIDKNTSGDQLYAMEMKLSVLFAAADIDVFILDREYYERFAKQGLFMNLDEIAPRLGIDVSKNQELIVAIEKNKDLEDILGEEGTGKEEGTVDGPEAAASEEPHLYGIDVSNSIVLKDAGIIADDMIATISLGTEKQEKAEAFLKFLLK